VAPMAEQPSAAVEKPQVPLRPRQKAPERHKVVKPAKTVEPAKTPPIPLQQDPIPDTAPAAGIAEARPGVAAGAVNGDSQGVIGGVAGGQAGGVIGGQGTEALPVNQVANPPMLLARVTPEYPKPARLQGVEGLVLLEAILNLEGQIEEDIKVL